MSTPQKSAIPIDHPVAGDVIARFGEGRGNRTMTTGPHVAAAMPVDFRNQGHLAFRDALETWLAIVTPFGVLVAGMAAFVAGDRRRTFFIGVTAAGLLVAT